MRTARSLPPGIKAGSKAAGLSPPIPQDASITNSTAALLINTIEASYGNSRSKPERPCFVACP